LSLLAAGRVAGGEPASSGHAIDLIVDTAWVREPAPGSDVGAAYFTLRNTGSQPAIIVAISCPLAAMTMLHETTFEGGTARMRPRERLEIAPRQTLVLKPGGLHVMLHGLKRMLQVGERVPLTLQLASGDEIPLTAQVRPLGSK
jgi:copper(I)-binding protein